MTIVRVDTTGLERAQVLVALVNEARPRGAGHLNPNASATMTYSVAAEIINDRRDQPNVHDNPVVEKHRYYFDYVGGRPIKVDLGDETSFDPDLYDHNGAGYGGGYGAAQRIITALRLRIRRQGG